MKFKLILIVITALVLNGCTHYESRVALGAVAGAATGALVADATTPYYGNGYGGGHYGGYRPRYYEIRSQTPPPPLRVGSKGAYIRSNRNAYDAYKFSSYPR